jgi:hypothetical protein
MPNPTPQLDPALFAGAFAYEHTDIPHVHGRRRCGSRAAARRLSFSAAWNAR